METVSREEIKGKLCKHSGYPPEERKLVEVRPICDYGEVGAIILIINGSPPKGYALCIPELRKISLYDSHGKRFKIMRETVLEETGSGGEK
ncbi:hypothetical protein AKJ57_01040 [candidate division MSBL1 archaeon SCGC-AAA259A05]|uniref:Uncharacterized protein n=1 Tax=candidate division MSBL1 archaeon SCGC-AAA259A05 TaxID=1698259 RepID=A0A133UBD9_9EURY|nr:hypothetical protein AKJ57_01040 [candidate division MSBL1 archaeon SCGC-AAA259A05]